MERERTYLFAGGGTGGHLYPGVAVAEELLSRRAAGRILFCGSDRPIEQDIVSSAGFEHQAFCSAPLAEARRNPAGFLWRNFGAYRAARSLVACERPAAVIGLGSFASAPVVLAAVHLRIPTLLLEQNVVPGRATLWLSRFADGVCASFSESCKRFPRVAQVSVTGNPVRGEIASLALRARPAPQRSLLVLGGSLGADSLNEAVLAMIRETPEPFAGWRVVHQSGPRQAAALREAYAPLPVETEVAAFLPDMAERYNQASLVVMRAGATSLAELACACRPAILIPYPQSADNHQWYNAQSFAAAGAVEVVSENTNDPRETGRALLAAFNSITPERAARMQAALARLARPEAAASVVEHILTLQSRRAA